MSRRIRVAGLLAGIAFVAVRETAVAEGEGPPTPSDAAAVEFFERSVRPVLAERCQSCHGSEKQKGGLRLDSRASVLRGGETGPAAVPGKPAESPLIEAVNYGDDLQMPPKSKLPPAEVATLTRWVEMGLPWAAEAEPGATPAGPGRGAGFDLEARRSSHWAWKPVGSPAVPEVKDRAWPRDPVDRFLLARLETQGLTPAADADRRAMIRRLSFDLTGLPPTPAQVDAYLSDPGDDADERLVDRLLASPQFGERWGRHWLDLVRYAESRGHEFDATVPNAWQYRDYVIRALNADVPYDRFLTEHLAGDLIDAPRLDPATGSNESVLATGFWFLGEEVHSPVDVRQDETDRMDNRLDVMTKTFLGLTVACARCHDHKFDAISQRDYYALGGFLVSSGYRQARFASDDRERRAAAELQTLRDAARRRVLSIAARSARPGVARLADDLLAARASLRDGDVSTGGPGPRVKAWAAELTRATADPAHPLHAFATASGPDDDAAGRRAEPVEGARRLSGREVVDFGKLDTLSGLQDGHAFGPRPVRPGDLEVFRSTGPPGLALATRGAARRDPAFRTLSVDPASERDHGRLGTWERSGQTLKTPEFVVGTGRLWYLARGAGRAYAAVNSHLLVAGPLHGKVLTEWTDAAKGWRWVRHDLTNYRGNRTHVEFSPIGSSPLEIARVVEADGDRGDLPPVDAPGLGAGGNGRKPADAAALAATAQKRFEESLRRMESDSIAGGDSAALHAAFAGWVVRDPGLFDPDSAASTRAALVREAEDLLRAEESVARALSAAQPTAPAMVDGPGVNEHLLVRGSSRTPGPEVPRRFLEAIAGDESVSPPDASDAGSGRRELARQMLAPTNPFSRRVIVNRVWHHLFGKGIVASVDNLGVLGERPTHPELLDHLADRFVRGGWSLKGLIRSLVLTRAYRMSSRPDPAADAADPENRWLRRMPIRRLEAEPIRDAILAVSGRLDARMQGPSVPVHLTEFMTGRGRPPKSGPLDGDGRRSVYTAVRRNFLSPMMLAFDAPIPFTTIGRRNVSNVPAQALILMNDPFVVGQARVWADAVLAGPDRSPASRVDAMYRSALARPPWAVERDEALDFLRAQGLELGLPADAWRADPRVWADLGHVLFNSKEFLYLD